MLSRFSMRSVLGTAVCLFMLQTCNAFVPSIVGGLTQITPVRHMMLRQSRARFALPVSAGVRLRMSSEASPESDPIVELIEKMLTAAPYDLPQLVGQNLREISSPSFFLKIASLSDETDDSLRRESLAALADNIVATLEVVSKTAEEQMDSAAVVVQGILAKAAEASGEFKMPLSDEKIAAMRNQIVEDREKIDEGVLATIFAYMKKANEDQLDGLVLIFQKALQLFAAEELLESKPKNPVLVRLLEADSDDWDAVLKKAMAGDEPETDEETLQAAVQACIETVVLQKASGSYGQRVQAEFLKEIMSRVREVNKPSGEAEAA